MTISPALLAAADAKIADLADKVERLRAAEADEKIECARDGRSVGDGAWKARHAAELRLAVAVAVRDAIAEVLAEPPRGDAV